MKRESNTQHIRQSNTANISDREFEVFFKQNFRRVYNMAFHVTGNVQEAEEITQEVFYNACRSASAYKGEAKLSSWVCGIAVNVINNHLRKKTRTPKILPQTDFNRTAVDSLEACEDANPDKSFFRKETNIRIRNALLNIPPKCRIVFFLYVMEGYSHSEIARMTGMTAGASRLRLMRAVRLLREQLGDSGLLERD